MVLGYEAYQALYRSLLITHTARYGLIYVSHELRLSCGLDLRARMIVRNTLPGVFSVMVNTTLIWVRVPEYPILP